MSPTLLTYAVLGACIVPHYAFLCSPFSHLTVLRLIVAATCAVSALLLPIPFFQSQVPAWAPQIAGICFTNFMKIIESAVYVQEMKYGSTLTYIGGAVWDCWDGHYKTRGGKPPPLDGPRPLMSQRLKSAFHHIASIAVLFTVYETALCLLNKFSDGGRLYVGLSSIQEVSDLAGLSRDAMLSCVALVMTFGGCRHIIMLIVLAVAPRLHMRLSQPAMFQAPYLASSPKDLWSRWHQLFRNDFMRLGYRPTRALFKWLRSRLTNGSTGNPYAAASVSITASARPESESGMQHPTSTHSLSDSKPAGGKDAAGGSMREPSTSSIALAASSVQPLVTDDHNGNGTAAAAEQHIHDVIKQPQVHGAASASVVSGSGKRKHKRSTLLAALSICEEVLPVIMCFVISGLLHEYMCWAAFGVSHGWQFSFFFVHGVAVCIEGCADRVVPTWRKHVPWAVQWAAMSAFSMATSILFMWPWLQGGYPFAMWRVPLGDWVLAWLAEKSYLVY